VASVATHLRTWRNMPAESSDGPSFTVVDAVRWNQRATSSPAALPCPLSTNCSAVSPSSQPVTSNRSSRSQARRGGTRNPESFASPAAARASCKRASSDGSSA